VNPATANEIEAAVEKSLSQCMKTSHPSPPFDFDRGGNCKIVGYLVGSVTLSWRYNSSRRYCEQSRVAAARLAM
jgi:hypothetical protein